MSDEVKMLTSKKFRMVVIGMIGVMLVFLVSMLVIVLKPEIAGSVTSVASVAITALGGLVGIYTAAQGAADFKTATPESK